MKFSCFYIILLCAIVTTACKKDHGNYDYSQLPKFSVDTSGMGGVREVTQFNELKIEPKINYDGDAKTLAFIWRIYQRDGKGQIDTIAKDRNLQQPISREPGDYFVELQASQLATGITEVAVFSVTVVKRDALPRGLMVFEEKDGHADISLVTSSSFLTGNTVQENVLRNIFYANNGEYLTGGPIQAQTINSAVYLLTTNDMKSVDASSFKVSRDFSQFFYGGQSVAPAPNVVATDGTAYINNRTVYKGRGQVFTAAVFAEDEKPYEAAPYIIPTQYPNSSLFYDQVNMRYLLIPELSNKASAFNKKGPLSIFNPSAVGKRMLLQGMGYPINTIGNAYKSSWAVFANATDNGERFLYILNAPMGALGRIDISSATDIRQAGSFAVGDLNAFCLYGSGGKLYRVQADLVTGTSSVNSESGFTAPAGEVITAIEILKTTNKLVFVATWNQGAGTGKLYLLNLNEVGGNVTGMVKTWEGFGRISHMNLKDR